MALIAARSRMAFSGPTGLLLAKRPNPEPCDARTKTWPVRGDFFYGERTTNPTEIVPQTVNLEVSLESSTRPFPRFRHDSVGVPASSTKLWMTVAFIIPILRLAEVGDLGRRQPRTGPSTG